MEGASLSESHDQDADSDDFDWGEGASTFGDRMARAREFQNMNQSALARRLGMRVSTIRNWEADRSEPRANKLQMLAGMLNVSMIWLLTGEGEGAPAFAEAEDGDLRDVLSELRDLRVAQARLSERAGLIEKRLRTVLADQ